MGAESYVGEDSGAFPYIWPDLPPADLALRLADALQYECAGPQDLWYEISDWLSLNRVRPPNLRPLQLVSQDSRKPVNESAGFVAQAGSPMQITRLVYTSRHDGLGTEVFEQILQTSRANNARDLVTGALVIGSSHLAQVLEGSRKDVSNCFSRIMRDRRHCDVQVMSCGDVAQRLFQDWSMHVIKASQIKEEVLTAFEVCEAFDLAGLSEFAMEDLCRTLSAGNWEVRAA